MITTMCVCVFQLKPTFHFNQYYFSGSIICFSIIYVSIICPAEF